MSESNTLIAADGATIASSVDPSTLGWTTPDPAGTFNAALVWEASIDRREPFVANLVLATVPPQSSRAELDASQSGVLVVAETRDPSGHIAERVTMVAGATNPVVQHTRWVLVEGGPAPVEVQAVLSAEAGTWNDEPDLVSAARSVTDALIVVGTGIGGGS